MPLLRVAGLSHRYGDREVLSIPDWQLVAGEHQLLVGPSGSGKTTFLGILSGLLSLTKGSVEVLGKLIDDMPLAVSSAFRAKNFGFVFQDHHLVSSLTVEENLALARHLAGLREDTGWTNRLFDQLGLTSLRASSPASLSHGEAQRAAIARAAVTRPPMLLADEPTSALDDENASRVMELLKALSEEAGATLLVASHDSRIKSFFKQSLMLETLQEHVA